MFKRAIELSFRCCKFCAVRKSRLSRSKKYWQSMRPDHRAHESIQAFGNRAPAVCGYGVNDHNVLLQHCFVSSSCCAPCVSHVLRWRHFQLTARYRWKRVGLMKHFERASEEIGNYKKRLCATTDTSDEHHLHEHKWWLSPRLALFRYDSRLSMGRCNAS